MKLLHVVHSANPSGGGVVEGIYQLSKVHRAQGHDIEVASVDSPEARWVKNTPIPVHALGPATRGYGYSRKFRQWLKQQTHDAIIVNGLWQYPGFAVWQACRESRIPYFVFPHGMLDPWFKKTYPLKHLKKWLYWLWAEYRVLRDARAVLFTTEEERQLARKSFWLYKAKEEVIGYGTNAPLGDPDQQRIKFLTAYPQLAGKRIFLFLGRIHPKKGCDLLLEAFSRVASWDPALRLVFAGPNQVGWQERLEKLSREMGIPERVFWTGMLEGELKWGAIRSAEVFVLPSHQENFGIAVAEALACGVPVLISNKVNIWREIQQVDAGFVEADTLEGTTRLLEKWMELKHEQRLAYSKSAAECFHKQFRIDAVAERMTAFIQRSIRQ